MRMEDEGRPQNSSRKGGRVLTNEQRVGAMGRKFLKEAVALVTADAAAPPDPSVLTTVLRSRTGPGVHSWGFGGGRATVKSILWGDSPESMSLCTFQLRGHLPLCTSVSLTK